MLLGMRTRDYVVLQDKEGREVFNLKSGKDVDILRDVIHRAIDIIITNPDKVVNCDTLEILDSEHYEKLLKHVPRSAGGKKTK